MKHLHVLVVLLLVSVLATPLMPTMSKPQKGGLQPQPL